MATTDIVFAREVAKYASRLTYGIHKILPDEEEFLKLLNKQMIFMVLSDPACLEELSETEQDELEGILILHS